MLVADMLDEQSALLEVIDQPVIGLLEERAADQWHIGLEGAVGADRIDDGQAVGAAGGEVIGAEGRRLVHEAGAIVGRDVVGEDDVVRVGDVDQVEGALVAGALQIAPAQALEHLVSLAQQTGGEVFGDDECLPVGSARHDIGGIGPNSHRRIGHHGPRCRRPHEKGDTRVSVGERTAGQHGESHIDGGIDDGLVALGELVVGEPGAAAGAVRRDAVVLHEQALVEDLLERPPHRLDVFGCHRPVGVVHVDPKAHAPGHLIELVDVPEHGLAALGVELRDAEFLDVLLAGEAEFLLYGEFDGQAVAVPAGLARDVVALHRAVAREDVLEDAGLHVMGARLAVGGRWALVEHPRGATLRLGDRLVEDVFVRPELEDLPLHRR